MKKMLMPALLALSASPAYAGEWEFGAEIAGEVRYFPEAPLQPQQLEDWQASLTIEPDIRWETEDRKHQLVVIPFLRLDGEDDERSHADLREGYYRFNADNNWSLTLGAVKVFWGRTESRHLVDIINQTDGVEDIDEEDKLGQPMANLTLLTDNGTWDFFVMTGFRDRTFPGVQGRLRAPFTVDTDNPIFTRQNGREAVDVAVRYSHYVGNWDFGIAAFHGTSREPRFAIQPGGLEVRPVYDEITQGSVDLQYTKDAWLWKFEAIIREGQGDTFAAAVGGFEYSFYQIFEQNWDLGILAEYQYDGRDEGIVLDDFGPATIAPVSVADNDMFFGARLALNDTQDTALLAGAVIDVDDQSTGVFLEGARRLSPNWTGEIEARLFLNGDPANAAFALRDDDFINLRLTRYF